jgi:hypothetical protein
MEETTGAGKAKQVLVLSVAILLGFALGLGVQSIRGRATTQELARVTAENQSLDLGTRLGAALAESQRGNYERARQLMTGFFSDLQARMPDVEQPATRQELESILAQRDEIVTQLSRAEPEAGLRLNMIYSRYFAAVHPLGSEGVPVVTPSPPP